MALNRYELKSVRRRDPETGRFYIPSKKTKRTLLPAGVFGSTVVFWTQFFYPSEIAEDDPLSSPSE